VHQLQEVEVEAEEEEVEEVEAAHKSVIFFRS
jgi:hypothetical protein